MPQGNKRDRDLRDIPRPKGKGGGKKRNRRGRRGGGVRADARRDVGMVIRPQLRELNRQRRGARRDYREYSTQMKGLYGALGRQLADIGGDLGQDFGGIQGDYTEGVEGILGALEQTTAPDQGAFLNTLGTFALAGQNELSDNQAREAAWNASTRRQGGLESLVLQRNIRGDLQDVLDEIRFARRGVMADRGPLLSQRLDQLRQQQFQNRIAQQELALRRRALNQSGAGAGAWGGFISGFPTGADDGGGPGPGPGPGPDPLDVYRNRNRGLGGQGTVFGLGRGTGFDPRQYRG